MQWDRYVQPTGLPIVFSHSRARLALQPPRIAEKKCLCVEGASTYCMPYVTHRSCVALACGLGCNPRHVVGHSTRSDTEARTETWLNDVIMSGVPCALLACTSLRLHLYSPCHVMLPTVCIGCQGVLRCVGAARTHNGKDARGRASLVVAAENRRCSPLLPFRLFLPCSQRLRRGTPVR
jgi:hypothetical protein